jgi:hypothetical protein
MARRNINIEFTVRSCFTKTVKPALKDYWPTGEFPTGKAMGFTNKKSRVELLTDHVYDYLEAWASTQAACRALARRSPAGRQESQHATLSQQSEAHLSARTLCMVSTRGCGGTGIDCCAVQHTIDGATVDFPGVKLIIAEGMPSTLANYLREIGLMRCDDPCTQKVVISVDDYAHLRQRSYESNDSEFVLSHLSEVLALLVVCRECWHFFFGSKFGRPGERNGLPRTCANMCPGERNGLILSVNREKLCGVLQALLRSDSILLTDMTNAIYKNEDHSEAVFGKKNVHQYNVEFLILRLIASGSIECIDKKEKDGYKSYVT